MMKNYIKYGFFLASLAFMLFSSCDEDDTMEHVVDPKAEFTYAISELNPFEVEFTSNVRDRKSIIWDFGDGTTETVYHPNHVYAEEGVYTVTLTAYGEEGSTPAVVEQIITIELFDPTATFTYSTSTSNPLQLNFTSSTTYATSFAWDFGDGTISTEENPTHVYEASGQYEVTLTVNGFPDTTPAVVTQTVNAGEVQNLLQGTIIGHPGSWDGVNGLIGDAFDGDLSTFVDAPSEYASSGYVGYDYGEGNKVRLSLIKYAPRDGFGSRMVNAELRGSNDPTLTDYDVLYTITEEPTSGTLTEAGITETGTYRYVYYVTPPDGYCNVAELEFYGELNPFDSGLIDMSAWIEHVASPGVTVDISSNTINFSGIGGWSGSHIYQEVSVEAGTYQLSGTITVNSVIDETWAELIFSDIEPQNGQDYTPGVPYQVIYSTWNGSPTDAGTYSLGDANAGGEYPVDGIYTFDAPETFYIVIKSGSNQPYDLTYNNLAFVQL